MLVSPVFCRCMSLTTEPETLSSASEFAPIMDVAAEKLTIPKFTGLSSDDPSRFLDSFHSYSFLYNLNSEDDDARKIAAFHLKLSGPALVWFQSLKTAEGKDKIWKFVEAQFRDRYVDVKDNPVLLAEAELFYQMWLTPSQPLEEDHAQLVEKGERLGNSSKDILLKFIGGLPQQLGFYVRARDLTDHQRVLTEALIGEAHGYRLNTVTETPTVTSTTHLHLRVPRVSCHRCQDQAQVTLNL